MKCRQKKKQQFAELMEKKSTLEKDNLELKEKVRYFVNNMQYDNIQKQLKETKEENDDLKKRLDFMEKQQEILFSIVSESRNNASRNNFQPAVVQAQPVKNTHPFAFLGANVSHLMGAQMDQFARTGSEQKVGAVNSSAFKPSKCSSPSDEVNNGLASPTPQLAQMSSVGLGLDQNIGSGISQTQLLSGICATLMGKQM